MANVLKRFYHFRLFSLSIRNPDNFPTYKAKPGACFVWA